MISLWFNVFVIVNRISIEYSFQKQCRFASFDRQYYGENRSKCLRGTSLHSLFFGISHWCFWQFLDSKQIMEPVEETNLCVILILYIMSTYIAETCYYQGRVILHGKAITTNECVTCLCNNGRVTCDESTCYQYPYQYPYRPITPLPCSYRGRPILHGESLLIDVCTTCSCDNYIVKCDIKSCPPIFCDKPLTFEGECCELCPYCEYNCFIKISINTNFSSNRVLWYFKELLLVKFHFFFFFLVFVFSCTGDFASKYMAQNDIRLIFSLVLFKWCHWFLAF